jgi:hypothetical protein
VTSVCTSHSPGNMPVALNRTLMNLNSEITLPTIQRVPFACHFAIAWRLAFSSICEWSPSCTAQRRARAQKHPLAGMNQSGPVHEPDLRGTKELSKHGLYRS